MVYVFLANGFEEIEAIAVIDILRRAEIETVTVGIGGIEISSARNIKVTADIPDTQFNINTDFKAVILPGGGIGTENLTKSKLVDIVLDKAVKNNKYICAICAAPSILGKKGLLDGKEAICFKGFEKHLKGAKISHENVIADGKIITAKSAAWAIEFALKIVENLKSKESSDKIRKDIF